MRGKRSKQYRKLMHQYDLHFGFREPYQVLLDAEILEVAAQWKMDFMTMLEKTLHGKVKPMITQCSMRHLYNAQPKNEMLIQHAKLFERRRCNHHELDKPLSTLECFQSVIDPKGSKTNKHRYVVTSQNDDVRSYLRTIPGVPMIYLKRSVMIMEPMAGATEKMLQRDEKDKFRSGLKEQRKASRGTKRAREDDNDVDDDIAATNQISAADDELIGEVFRPQKLKKGPKGPNPLSVKKKQITAMQTSKSLVKASEADAERGHETKPEKKRKRRHKTSKDDNDIMTSQTLEP